MAGAQWAGPEYWSHGPVTWMHLGLNDGLEKETISIAPNPTSGDLWQALRSLRLKATRLGMIPYEPAEENPASYGVGSFLDDLASADKGEGLRQQKAPST
jgi:hypothetical protein